MTDFVDLHADLTARVRAQELRRNDGVTERAPNAPHPEPIAEWLSIPSRVPRDEFTIGREAWALWKAEQEIQDYDFHMFVRMARECARVIDRLTTLGAIRFNQRESEPISAGLSTVGWNKTAAKQPSAILVEQAPGWWTKVLIPGAPRVARLDTGVRNVPAGATNTIIQEPGEITTGVVLGQFDLYSITATPPNMILNLLPVITDEDGLLGPLEDAWVLVGPGGTPIISGYDRGSAYQQAPVQDSEGRVIAATAPFDLVPPVRGRGMPQAGDYWPMPWPSDESAADYARTMVPTDAEMVTHAPWSLAINDYLGNQVGYFYAEAEPAGILGVSFGIYSPMIYCWGAPVRTDAWPDELELDPSAEMLAESGIAALVDPGGQFLGVGGVGPSIDPHFDDVVQAVHDGVVPAQLTGWIQSVLDSLGTAPSYEHQWRPIPEADGLEWLERFGIVHIRGEVTENLPAWSVTTPESPPEPVAPVVMNGMRDGVRVPVSLVHIISTAYGFVAAEGDGNMRGVTLDGFAYPALDA
jgi:hypothetical protein